MERSEPRAVSTWQSMSKGRLRLGVQNAWSALPDPPPDPWGRLRGRGLTSRCRGALDQHRRGPVGLPDLAPHQPIGDRPTQTGTRPARRRERPRGTRRLPPRDRERHLAQQPLPRDLLPARAHVHRPGRLQHPGSVAKPSPALIRARALHPERPSRHMSAPAGRIHPCPISEPH